MSPSIRRLDPRVVDQIAAGEVVERPASVVKELVENALDAGGRRIEVLLEEGGIRRIEVRDDGCGIPRDELALAVASHATSKLRVTGDLDSIASLGFRGEALASVGAVSRLRIVSRPAKSERAAEILVRAGVVEGPRDAAGPPGTRVGVEDLFADLPARRRFLKRPATELAHCVSWAERLALAHPEAGFRLEHGGRLLLEAPPGQDLDARCASLLGERLAAAMVLVRDRREQVVVEARVGPPESARRDASRVHTLLNGRWVRDPRLLRAVREGVREFVPAGQHPVLVLHLYLPPEMVDVNVHPQKLEVRFREERFLMGFLIQTLRRGLAVAPWAGRRAGAVGGGLQVADGAAARSPAGGGGAPPPRDPPSWDRPVPLPATDRSAGAAPGPAPADGAFRVGGVLAVANTFLLREVPGGVEILDQHALHERVNLEELRAQVREGRVTAQPLLVPALVEVAREEVHRLASAAEDLRRLGVDLEAFGETTVAVRAMPARLERIPPEGLVADLLEILAEAGEAGPERLQDTVLQRMACRGAVMAGDRLDGEALADLLRRGAGLPQDRTCAHGRPVRVFLSVTDLERAFHRR